MFKKFKLRKSEIKWGLYNDLPNCNIEYLFAFIDQLQTGGNFNSQVVIDKDVCANNGTIVINLNKRVNETVIVHSLIHEDLHIAIRNCLYKNPSDFIEKVIDDWILRSKLTCNGWEGSINVETKSPKTTDKEKS